MGFCLKETMGQDGDHNTSTMSLKLDMSKSYDIIKWDFVLGVVEDFEFSTPMIQLIKICISFSFLL